MLDPLYHSKAEVRAHLRSVRQRRPAADAALAQALADLVLESAAQSVTLYTGNQIVVVAVSCELAQEEPHG